MVVLLAFAAGLLSFLSPCVLPMVPIYIGYLSGQAVKNVFKREGISPETDELTALSGRDQYFAWITGAQAW